MWCNPLEVGPFGGLLPLEIEPDNPWNKIQFKFVESNPHFCTAFWNKKRTSALLLSLQAAYKINLVFPSIQTCVINMCYRLESKSIMWVKEFFRCCTGTWIAFDGIPVAFVKPFDMSFRRNDNVPEASTNRLLVWIRTSVSNSLALANRLRTFFRCCKKSANPRSFLSRNITGRVTDDYEPPCLF